MPKPPKVAKVNNGGDNVSTNFGGKKPATPVVTTAEPVSSYDPDAPTTKPTKLTRQAGDRLFSNSERARLNLRGEHVGVGSNPSPVKPQNPAIVKLGNMVDYLKKGIYTPETFGAEVQRGGLQGKLDSIKQLGQTLFGSRGGGEIYSGTMQQSTVLKGLPKQPVLPQSTQVLGDAGMTLDSFRINQPPRLGAPTFARSNNLEYNIAFNKTGGFAGDSIGKLDPVTKAMGYKLMPPSQTGLPWAVAGDPATGEMLTLKGKPLPPLVGPSFPTSEVPAPIAAAAVPQSSLKPKSLFRQGFETSTGTQSQSGKSFFRRTPELTQGLGVLDRAKVIGGRLAGDVAGDATRNIVWRWNHPLAIAHGGFSALAGNNKAAGAVAAFAGVQALGQVGGQFDLTNPGQAFRPKGFEATYPIDETDKRKTDGGLGGWFGLKELVGRYVFNRGGRPLPYDQFKEERPDVSPETYEHYAKYLKGGGGTGKPMPEGSFDLGGLGVLKGTSKGINGPELRLAGFSVNTPAALAGTAVAGSVAVAFNPKVRSFAAKGVDVVSPSIRPLAGKGLGFVGKALPVVGAGLDFTQRLQQGQKIPQAVIGTAAGVVGGIKGFELGAKLTPGGPIPKFVGGLVGGGLGAVGAGAIVDQVAKVEAPDRKQFDASVEKAKKTPGVLGAVNRAIFAVGDVVTDPIGSYQKGLKGGQDTIDNQAAGDAAMVAAENRFQKAQARSKLVVTPEGATKSVPRDNATLSTPNTAMTETDPSELVDPKEKVAKWLTAPRGSAEDRLLSSAKLSRAKAARDAAYANPKMTADERKALDVAVGKASVENDSVQGGQGDRNNASKEAQTTQTNKTKLANTGLQNQGKLQNTDLQGRYGVKIAQTKGQYDNQGKIIQGEYGVKKAVVTGEYGVKKADVTGQYGVKKEIVKGEYGVQKEDVKGQYNVKVADVKAVATGYTADQKLRGTTYTADQKLNQEGVKQSGAVRVAGIKADATMGAAGIKADGSVKVASITAQGKLEAADLTSSRKAEADGSKAAASFFSNLNRDNTRSEASNEKNRIARLKQLGVY